MLLGRVRLRGLGRPIMRGTISSSSAITIPRGASTSITSTSSTASSPLR